MRHTRRKRKINVQKSRRRQYIHKKPSKTKKIHIHPIKKPNEVIPAFFLKGVPQSENLSETNYASMPPLEYDPVVYVGKPPKPPIPEPLPNGFLNFNNETGQVMEVRELERLRLKRKEAKDCVILYDPCTGNPIPGNDIKLLEQRVKEIKAKEANQLSETRKFPTDTVVNRLDLLLYILNRGKIPDESLLEFHNNGQLYESYWDIIFAFNLMEEFPNKSDFYLFGGKIETLVNIESDPNFSQLPITYLKAHKIMEGSSRGASDITFVYKNHAHIPKADTCLADSDIKASDSCHESKVDDSEIETRPLFYFCSSKYFKSDASKGIDKFDIQNIYTAAKQLTSQYDKKIVLLVRDREAVEGKIRKALRKYISEEASYVFGIKDLIAALTKLYTFIKSVTTEHITEDILRTIYNEGIIKPLLNLRLHQHMAVDKITTAVQSFQKAGSSQDNKFLVGIVPRGGKTYIAGGIINELKPKRVVVLLGAKSETLTQFKNDLFETFANFNEYTCIDVVSEDVEVEMDPSKKYIFIMSVELYKDQHSSRSLLKSLKSGELRSDLFICDEAHLKQTTERAAKEMAAGTRIVDDEDLSAVDKEENQQLLQIDKSINKQTPVVYMTGTYRKPMTVFKIQPENSIIWEYQDIQNAKDLSLNDTYFRDTFGDVYTNALDKCIKSNNETLDSIGSIYRKFPELHLITTQFTDDAKSAFLEQNESLGFPTISHLFEVKSDFDPSSVEPNMWYTGFKNHLGVARLVNYLTPTSSISQINDDAVEPISSALRSVDSIAQRVDDRLSFFTSEFITHTQLWFLPKMQRHPLKKRMTALVGVIFQSPWFRKHFHVLGVSSSVKWEIPGSENNRVKVRIGDSCGIFSWACPGSKSLKECILDEEAYARSKGKGLIILAQNMLHLGISLPCVDIVVLLDNGDNIDERIQKMYRALTESTNKKAGFIIDMNYFRTVTAIMEYQMTIQEARTGKKVRLYKGDDKYLKDTFYKALMIYSIDDDKPIYASKDEMVKGNSEIQKATIPELQKLFSHSRYGSDFKIEEVAKLLNSNINMVMGNTYIGEFDKFLQKYIEDKKKKKVRDEGEDVRRASRVVAGDVEGNENNNNDNNNNVSDKHEINNYVPQFIKTGSSKKGSYLEIFKTIMKLGVFGTNSADVKSLIDNIKTNKDNIREIIYDTLIRRGVIDDSFTEQITKYNQMMVDLAESKDKIKMQTDKIEEFLTKGDFEKYTQFINGKRQKRFIYTKDEKDKLSDIVSKLFEHRDSGIEYQQSEEYAKLLDYLMKTEYNKLDEEDRESIENKIAIHALKKERKLESFYNVIVVPGLERIVEENKNESYIKMKEGFEDDSKYPKNVKEVLEYIRDHLAPKLAERHKYGEVFTPMDLVNEMLDTLPNKGKDNVWNNKDLKWLDPANGMGNFPIAVFLRLFYGFRTNDDGKYVGITNEGEGEYNPGLTKIIPDDVERSNHIVKKMLYMVELNSKNIAISKKLFKKLAPNIEANIIQLHPKDGFLADIDMKFPNGNLNEFDIVMGNPPYNSGSTRAMTTNKTMKFRKELGVSDEKHKNLWIPFTNKSLNLLKNNGYLLFIMPIGWFKPDRMGIYQKMLSNQIHKMRIIFNTDAKRIFGGSGEINISYFLIEKTPIYKNTQIIDIYNNKDVIKLSPSSILSLAYNSIFSKVQKSVLFKDSEGYQTTSITAAKCKAGKHKQIHRITNEGEITFIKTEIQHPKQNVPKIILSGAKYPRFFFDKEGEYGLIGNDQHFIIGDNLNKIEDYFKTKLSALLLSSIKYRMKYIEPKFYPDVRTLPIDTITDETLADYFEFTKEEREIINAIEYPKREYKFKEITCEVIKKETSAQEGGSFNKTRKIKR